MIKKKSKNARIEEEEIKKNKEIRRNHWNAIFQYLKDQTTAKLQQKTAKVKFKEKGDYITHFEKPNYRKIKEKENKQPKVSISKHNTNKHSICHIHILQYKGADKDGTCPEPDQTKVCDPNDENNDCLFDNQCDGDLKCCSDGCLLKCLKPAATETKTEGKF